MSGEIRRATGRDADVVSEILADGFRRDPVMQWVFGAGVDTVLKPFFHFMVGEALIPLGATYVSDSSCAVWTPPEKDPWSRADVGERFLAALDSVLQPDQLKRMLTLSQVVDEIHPQEAHWYLGMIASRTAAQGTGAGTRMLTHTLQLVDAAGVPAYLESTNPANIPFYLRHGFVAVREAWLPDGPVLTQMRRTAPR